MPESGRVPAWNGASAAKIATLRVPATRGFAEFADAVRKAEDEAAARNVALIQKAAAEGTWQAAAWWLERKFPAEWGRVDRHEHTGRGGGSIQVQAAIDTEKIKARIIELARELGYASPPGIGPGEEIEVEAEEVERG